MGHLLGRFNSSFMIEGLIARFVYKSLYKMHLVACHGFPGTVLQNHRYASNSQEPPTFKISLTVVFLASPLYNDRFKLTPIFGSTG